MKNNKRFVFICDNKEFASAVTAYFKFKERELPDICYSSQSFLDKLSQYEKDTKICIDNSLKPEMSSLDLAKQLYELGYVRLYLLSAWDFDESREYERGYNRAPYDIPKYIRAIRKDEEMIESLVALAEL